MTNDMSAQGLVVKLTKEAGMTPQEISEALEGRVSSRTIYRWGNGESEPQNSTDREALETLVAAKCAS